MSKTSSFKRAVFAVLAILSLSLMAVLPAKAATPPISAGTPVHDKNSSFNWAGYVADKGTFTSVSGTWTVPSATGSRDASDATWVGIGGVGKKDLIQAGTSRTSVTNPGRVPYQAWYELLPQSATTIPLTVNAGDSVTVTITQQEQPDLWLITFTNNTSGQTYQKKLYYKSSLSSAEWVEEMPSSNSGAFVPLDDFGKVEFTGGSAVMDGKTVSIAESGARMMILKNFHNEPLAQPSAISADGTSFTIARTDAAVIMPPQRQMAFGPGRTGPNLGRPGFPAGFPGFPSLPNFPGYPRRPMPMPFA